MRNPVFPLIAALVLILYLPACRADVTGGYAASIPGALIYSRLIQHGSSVTGYMQLVLQTNMGSSGTQVERRNLSGSISGNSIEFVEARGDAIDGTWGSNNLSLEFPLNGYVKLLKFHRVSIETWNNMVTSFLAKQAVENKRRQIKAARDAKASQIRIDEQLKADQFNTAFNDLPIAKEHLVKALDDQARGQAALKKAQSDYDVGFLTLKDTVAVARAKIAAVRLMSSQMKTQADHDAAEAAATDAKEAMGVAEKDRDALIPLKAKLDLIKNDQTRGLPAADRIVNEAQLRVQDDEAILRVSDSTLLDGPRKHHAPPLTLKLKPRS